MTEDNRELCNNWTLWAHLPNEIGWGINNYLNIQTVNTIEECIVLTESLNPEVIKFCMLFYMKDGIQPLWEAPQNCNGGVFSLKISNNAIPKIWKDLMYALAGRCLSNDPDFMSAINGISVSPKKNFVILKIWMASKRYLNPVLFDIPKNMEPISFRGCLFTNHDDNRKRDKKF